MHQENEPTYPFINIYTVHGRYRAGDTITVSVSAENKGESKAADIYIVMLDPFMNLYFATSWSTDFEAVLYDVFFPTGFEIPKTSLFNFSIPNTIPPIANPGNYIFAVGLTEPGTFDFFHVCSARFDIFE